MIKYCFQDIILRELTDVGTNIDKTMDELCLN